MLTPLFEVSQTNEDVVVRVKIPNLRFSDKSVQISVNGKEFVFYLSPYHLRLTFNEELLNEDDLPEVDENGREARKTSFAYDSANEVLEVSVPKKNVGEIFSDLDYLHKLMMGSKKKPRIEVLGGEANSEAEASAETMTASTTVTANIYDDSNTTDDIKKHIESLEMNGEEFDWKIPQQFKVNNDPMNPYGFDNLYSGVIETSILNGNDVNEVHPPGLSATERCELRASSENQIFDQDYYVSNYLVAKYGDDYDHEMLVNAIKWENTVEKAWAKHQKDPAKRGTVPSIEFSSKEKQLMIDLPKKARKPVDNLNDVYYAIVSIIYAYNLTSRLNCGEPEDNPDSAWVIGKIVPQFGALDSLFVVENAISVSEGNAIKVLHTTEAVTLPSIDLRLDKLKALVVILIKRSLIYPLFRHFDLVNKALFDTYYTFRFGLKKVIRVLFKAREFFRRHSTYYVYNDIWMNDLVGYLNENIDTREVNEGHIRKLAHEFHNVIKNVKREDVVFESLELAQEGADVDQTDLQTLEFLAESMYGEG